MTPRMASYTSSQYCCQVDKSILENLGFSEKSFSELIATSLTPYGEEVVTPLGIKLTRNGVLVARFFPGTRLYEKAGYLTHLCLAQPRTILPYYYAVLRRLEIKPEMEPAEAVPGTCLTDYTVRIETVVATRTRTSSGLLVAHLIPLALRLREPIVYTRAYGCGIEQLIALTRIRALSHRASCRKLQHLFRVMIDSLNCILHSTTDTTMHKYGFEAVMEASQILSISGCPIPV